MNRFYGVKETAANIGTHKGYYTEVMFKEDFPQFFNAEGKPVAPKSIMSVFINRANASVQPDKWLDVWRYAAGLYTAHYLTMYLKTYAEYSDTPEQAAQTGALVGVVKAASLGDSSVTYDTDALTKATEEWGNLNATQYGQMLATEARLVGLGGSYCI